MRFCNIERTASHDKVTFMYFCEIRNEDVSTKKNSKMNVDLSKINDKSFMIYIFFYSKKKLLILRNLIFYIKKSRRPSDDDSSTRKGKDI